MKIPFLSIPNWTEFRRFLAKITMTMEAKLFAQEETVIALGDRMQGVHLVTRGVAFGGVAVGSKQKWGVFTIGQWFGTEGLLLERRHMYEVKAVKVLEIEFISKASLDNVISSGDFKTIHKSIRKACLKCMFLLSVKRYVERLQKFLAKSGKQCIDFVPTFAERAYIVDGVFAVLQPDNAATEHQQVIDTGQVRVKELDSLKEEMSAMRADMCDMKAGINAIRAALSSPGGNINLPNRKNSTGAELERMNVSEIEQQVADIVQTAS